MRKHVIRYFATALAVLLCAAILATPAPGQIPNLRTGGTVPTLAPLVREVTPAVVNISVRGRIRQDNPLYRDPLFREFFDVPKQLEKEINATGSGVIVDAQRGYVLTNNHVVDQVSSVRIKTKDGRQFSAKVIGRDPATDIAVLRIQAPVALQAIAFGDSDALEVGDFVIAIGNPFGLGQTVTSGLVSALGRTGLGKQGYEDFIQTDAAINPGNSGGALVNLKGELVGINSAIISPGGGNVGIGFAIPVNMARRVMGPDRREGARRARPDRHLAARSKSRNRRQAQRGSHDRGGQSGIAGRAGRATQRRHRVEGGRPSDSLRRAVAKPHRARADRRTSPTDHRARGRAANCHGRGGAGPGSKQRSRLRSAAVAQS
jgi:S1-C subfamily serine protease